jgi:hypothetical protein
MWHLSEQTTFVSDKPDPAQNSLDCHNYLFFEAVYGFHQISIHI